MAKTKTPQAVSNPAAVASGALAGVSSHFKTAIEQYEAVIERCDKSLDTGKMGATMAKMVRDIREECVKQISALRSLWRDIDGIVLAGVALPEKTKTEDLFQ